MTNQAIAEKYPDPQLLKCIARLEAKGVPPQEAVAQARKSMAPAGTDPDLFLGRHAGLYPIRPEAHD